MKKLLKSISARLVLGGGLLAAVSMVGCGDDPVAVDPVAEVNKTPSTDNQQGEAGEVLPLSPEVTILRASGAKAVGEAVTFTVETGGGTVVGAVVLSDDRGTARVTEWVLGQIAAPNSLKATVSGMEVTFNAIGAAGPATMVVLNAGNEQTAPVSTEVAIRPQVMVTDQYGNGVDGQTVNFRAVRGGGTVVGNNDVISENGGFATVGGWELGATPVLNLLDAVVSEFPTVQFRATATP
jgi:hypothetical protein